MKTLSVVALALFAAPLGLAASPCPNLSGTYACQDSAGAFTITQTESEGVTTYEINGQKIIANSQTQQTGDNSDFQANETYSCQDGALIRKLSMGPASTLESYTADAQGLHITRSLEAGGNSMPQGQKSCPRRQ